MKLKYVGPKPIISEHGVSFKDGKEDKYVYIQNALELLQALNHEYIKDRIYKYDSNFIPLTDKEIEKTILKYKPELQSRIEKEITSYKQYLDNEIEDVSQTHPLLNEVEVEALQNNLKIMYDYRIQRAINKIYYMHIIEILADVIKEHRIKDISTPFNEKFWHVMQTIQGELAHGRNSIDSKLNENENVTLELEIRF